MVNTATKAIMIAAGVGALGVGAYFSYRYFKTPSTTQKSCQQKTPTTTQKSRQQKTPTTIQKSRQQKTPTTTQKSRQQKTPDTAQKRCEQKTPAAPEKKPEATTLDSNRYDTTDADLARRLKGVFKCINKKGCKVWSIDAGLKQLYDVYRQAERVLEDESVDEDRLNNMQILKDQSKVMLEEYLGRDFFS